jgi:ABC-type nitrate/sulfonate/bicarbonate transport system permease component
LLGFTLVYWPILEKSTYPYVVGFQSLPKVALAPLMVVWFGFGLEGKVFITAVITFFPVLVNTMDRLSVGRARAHRARPFLQCQPVASDHQDHHSELPAVSVRWSQRGVRARHPRSGGG